MENMFDLSIDNMIYEAVDIDSYTESNEFIDIIDVIEEAHSILQSGFVITEEVHSNSIGLRKNAQMAIKNTIDTTRTANQIAGEVSTAEAGIFKATWDLFAKCAGLVAKFVSWIFGIIEKIPGTLLNIINKITDIPGNIKTKIRGDMKLYITIKDIQALYDGREGYTLMGHLTDYITAGNKLINIDHFTSSRLFSSKEDKAKTKEEDKLEKDIIWLSKHIRAVEFKQTIIDLSKEENRHIYLDNKAVVNILGKPMSYKDAILKFCHDIKEKRSDIEHIKTEYAKMMADPSIRESMSKLSTFQCAKLNEISNVNIAVFSFISNVLKYVMTDIKTLNKAIVRIDKRNTKEVKTAFKKGDEEVIMKKLRAKGYDVSDVTFIDGKMHVTMADGSKLDGSKLLGGE